MKTREARCACGQLRLTCREEPVLIALCHCRDCQHRTGSAFGVAAFYPREAVTVVGRYTDYDRAADSGFRVLNHFCAVCASTVFWEPSKRPELVAVALGAFADPAFPAPQREVFEKHRHPWVTVAFD